jgi:hypothetical protein
MRIYPIRLISLGNARPKSSGVKEDPLNILYSSVNAGISVQWFFHKPFFVEAGLDYFHLFSVDKPAPGYIKPEIAIGLQL